MHYIMSMNSSIRQWADRLAPHIYLSAPKSGLPSATFCVHVDMQPSEPATSAIILEASARRSQIDWIRADIVSSLRDNLTSWVDGDVAASSQREFWKFLDVIRKPAKQ